MTWPVHTKKYYAHKEYYATKGVIQIQLIHVEIMFSVALQVYNACSDTFDSYDQHYGRGLVKDTVKDGMCLFIYTNVISILLLTTMTTC